ncbi:MAG TPA: DNA gyrase subunit A [Candidatus Brocadiia bacterium]|nr:DNA gyrase subunit A [Candidatus Brocadiia bacterium]
MGKDQLVSRESYKDLDLTSEMRDSYLLYAMSVIVSRALPDVRDGMKPVQRRIMAAMEDLNLGPRSKRLKSARIVGDTMGRYHPHGDSSIYMAMVRMAQPFTMRYPLVSGQGNFGSIDGDPPAAMRYTEARMAPPAADMLEDMDKKTVDFRPNYDDTRVEPVVLPGKFPNMLCNGSLGIAVGMATSFPPHNVREVCDAIVKVLDHPETTTAEIMKVLPGPDFPTGGIICGRKGIREAYETGRGRLVVRAKAHVETAKSGKQSIVFTEIPYGLNRDRILERIAELVKEGQIQGVADLRNESDRNGSRLVVELKKGEDADVLLNLLYKNTSLQDTFQVMMIALVNGQPKCLPIKESIQEYIKHRREVITRRTRFLLEQAEAKAHVLQGLIIALDNIDRVIEIIRASKDAEIARNRLMKAFGLSEIQAQAILDMRLQRLTGLERDKVRQELEETLEKIRGYKAILSDDSLLLDVIREDLYEIKEKYGDERRTQIADEVGDFAMEDLIAEENVTVTISHEGYIKRQPVASFRRQGRGGKGVTGARQKEGDLVASLFVASTHDYIMFFTDKGRVYWLKVFDIPEMGRMSRGRAIVNLIEAVKDEKITATIPVRDFTKGDLFMFTERGVVKRTSLEAYSRPKKGGIIAVKLDEDDRLIAVRLVFPNQSVVVATRKGQAVRFPEATVRAMGRDARGVRAVKLRDDDRVVGAVAGAEDMTLLTVCENGMGKRTPIGEYRETNRGGLGVINIRVTEKNGDVVGVLDVIDEDELILMTQQGMTIRLPVKSVRVIGRATQGVKLIKVEEGDKVVSVARVEPEEEGAEGGAEQAAPEAAAQAEPETAEEDEAPEEEPPSGEEEA